MNHITSTALTAGTQELCVKSAEQAFPGMGALTLQPFFRPVSRREIMTAVNICGRDLGLRSAAVVVLDALLSCLPCKDGNGNEAPVTPSTLLTIFASNQTLCFRAKGLTDRQLRRHLDTLEKAKLILRRDSANGKRFPVMQHGKAIGAFGLDLSPLFARADELRALARQRQEEAEELRGLKARIMRLRAACNDLTLDEATATFVDGLRNLLRRASLTLIEARAMLTHLTEVISAGPAQQSPENPNAEHAVSALSITKIDTASLHSESNSSGIELQHAKNIDAPNGLKSNQTPASDGRYVRHKEPDSDTKKIDQSLHPVEIWQNLNEINAFYSEPDNFHEASTIAFSFGSMLRISQDLIARAVRHIGLWRVLRLENEIAGKIETLLNPEAYFRAALRC